MEVKYRNKLNERTAAPNMGLPKVGQNSKVEHLEFY
jgi:hypothetical protein